MNNLKNHANYNFNWIFIMNLTMKSTLLDAGVSILLTLIGGGNFYSFLFFFVLLLIPAIAIFITIDNMRNASKVASNSKTKKET